MNIDWNTVCTVATTGATIMALFISVMQMWMSNKQQLLNRRICIWTKTQGLMELCKEVRPSLEKMPGGPEFTNDLPNDVLFQVIADSSVMHNIGPVEEHPLEEWQPRLLAELEEINEMAFEAALVFKGPASKALGEFISDYVSLLMSMYGYQTMLKDYRKDVEKRHDDLNGITSAVREEKERVKLYEARTKLLNSLDQLSPLMVKKLRAQCRLSLLS